MDYWIVVVDDEAFSLANARRLLSSQNMRVSCLRSGHDLLKFIQKNTPDLILLDIFMPEMDGFETLHALREYEDDNMRNHTPVIFLTGDSDSDTEQRGLKEGASDFIRKPFNQDILLRRIHNTIVNSKTIESLTEEASIDKLTGFLNKSSGTKRIAGLCSGEQGFLMILDLDSFKLVNDLYGHDMGDHVLMAFAEIFKENTRDDDVISRIGGDEFMAFLGNTDTDEAISSLTERLNKRLTAICQKLMGDNFEIPIGISVGAVKVPDCGTDFDTLFGYADKSLYKIKQNGKHGYELYSPENKEMVVVDDLSAEINRISQIVEERGDGSGALLLGLDSFASNYRFIMRFMKRYKGKANKILFSISLNEENDNTSLLDEVSEEFGLVLQRTLRKSDIILRSKANQYFLLLPELSRKDVPGVVGRIMNNWEKNKRSNYAAIRYASQLASFEDEDI